MNKKDPIAIALDAFNQRDYINGTMSGGIEAPRVILGIRTPSEGTVKIDYTYQETCGLSDCRYTDKRAGKVYTETYAVSGNRVTRDGNPDLFGIKNWGDPDLDKIEREFYERWGMVDTSVKWNDYPSGTLYLWNGQDLYIVAEGTGDNLTAEDEENGYKDYWMTECYTLNRDDGGQWLETEFIQEIDYTLQGVIARMMTCDLWEDEWQIISEDQGQELLKAMSAA